MRASHDARLLERLVLFRLVPERGGVHRVEGACIPREMGYGYKVCLVTVLWCVWYPLREPLKNCLADFFPLGGYSPPP